MELFLNALNNDVVIRELTAEEAVIVAIPPQQQTALANQEAENNRGSDFQTEADPLFFGWQRGENTEQAWRDKCDEIRARYPYQ